MASKVESAPFRSAMVTLQNGIGCGQSVVLDDSEDWRGRAILVLMFGAANRPQQLPGGPDFPQENMTGLPHFAEGLPAVFHTGRGGPDHDLRIIQHMALTGRGGRTLAYLYADDNGALRLRSAVDGRVFPILWICDLGAGLN